MVSTRNTHVPYSAAYPQLTATSYPWPHCLHIICLLLHGDQISSQPDRLPIYILGAYRYWRLYFLSIPKELLVRGGSARSVTFKERMNEES